MKTNIGLCRVGCSRLDDIDKGIIYIPSKHKIRSKRKVGKITFRKNGVTIGSIYCEVLYIDYGYIAKYNSEMEDYNKLINSELNPAEVATIIQNNDKVVLLSKYYRDKINIEEDSEYEVIIMINKYNLWHYCLHCIQHPQAIVKITFWFALTSIALGLIGTGERILCLIRYILEGSIYIHNWLIQAIDWLRSFGC